MGITYTPNLNLGLQLDKTDYVNWDNLMDNFVKLDNSIVPAASKMVRKRDYGLMSGENKTFPVTQSMLLHSEQEREEAFRNAADPDTDNESEMEVR